MLTTATTDAVWDTPDTDTATATPVTDTDMDAATDTATATATTARFPNCLPKQQKQAVLHQDLSLKNGLYQFEFDPHQCCQFQCSLLVNLERHAGSKRESKSYDPPNKKLKNLSNLVLFLDSHKTL